MSEWKVVLFKTYKSDSLNLLGKSTKWVLFNGDNSIQWFRKMLDVIGKSKI